MQLSGAVLGGIAIGTTVTAAQRTDRFIVETRGGRTPEGVNVVHELPGVKFAVVEAGESELKESKTVKGYAADVEIELDAPEISGEVPTFDASEYKG